MYQSMAKIKLDDHKYGMSANNLYEDFDVFATENKIETEAEILKSPLLVQKAIGAMGLDVFMEREGAIKSTFLYRDNPFIIHHLNERSSILDQHYLLHVDGDSFDVLDEEEEVIVRSSFNEPFRLLDDTLVIEPNHAVIDAMKITTQGNYTFQIKSENGWISYLNERLDVKAIDKEIPVLRVVVKSESPAFSADFANTLCQVYVDDYIYTKSIAASKTLNFIDERIASLQSALTNSEDRLEGYKQEHNVVNTLQETETGLHDISKLKLQLINLEMEENAVGELDSYITNGDYYEETAISFGFGDLLLTELVKKLKIYTDEKRDLLLKYTKNDPKIINIQAKIDDIEAYVKEAITQNLRNIEIKRVEIEQAIAEMSNQFDDIPTREKDIRILERDFQINETVYTFLAQKKLEAQIAASALMSFHRVIQPAIAAREPISPNKVLITFVCGFLGLMGGIFIVFGGKLIRGRILSKVDIEKLSATPVIGVLPKMSDSNQVNGAFTNLAAAIRLQAPVEKQTVVITSSIRNEGKTFLTQNLANVFAKMGYAVAVLDINSIQTQEVQTGDFTLQELLTLTSSTHDSIQAIAGQVFSIRLANTEAGATLTLSHKNMPALMDVLKEKFDYILIDTPGSVISIDALCMLRYADLALYVIRAKHSKAQYTSNVDSIQVDQGFDRMRIVFNGAHNSTNYSGNFNGSQLNYEHKPSGFIKRIKHYLTSYSS